MMVNPLKLPVPEDFVDKVDAFARDLAYGVLHGAWDIHVNAFRPNQANDFVLTESGQQDYSKQFWTKWRNGITYLNPHFSALEARGYVDSFKSGSNDSSGAPYTGYKLIPKAFELLDKPARPPEVFISYRRAESSAFALLIEARLRLVGNPTPFVDKNIQAGEDWAKRLQETIEASKYFIILIGDEKIWDSEWVQNEIRWAENAGCTIISVWHNGMLLDSEQNKSSFPKVLAARQKIDVKEESALGYETAVNQVLNALGYRTY